MNFEERFQPIRVQMQAAGLPPLAIKAFRYYYGLLVTGSTGLIADADLDPIASLPDAETLSTGAAGREALSRTVVLKLNGGLGTSMGLERAKSLLPVKDGLNFLDIIARQTLGMRERTGCRLPLLLMNSFATHRDSLEALEKYPSLETGLPLAFVQHMEPKILVDGLVPADPEMAGDLAWCPPGHGDLYIALQTTGLLAELVAQGYEFLFSSNSDNLGAVIDERILGYFAEQKLPFLMEAAERTGADTKGGHLARLRDGRLILRERAQCPPGCEDLFEDTSRYRYFNTNNVWVHLPSLQRTLSDNDGVLKLPLIRNRKTLDPRDKASPPVYQLETAMGSAIEIFKGAGAIRVPRTRFAPVKLSSDLLALWSDAYRLDEEDRVMLSPGSQAPHISLDERFYQFVDQLQERFPAGAPSLKECRSLAVLGNIYFGERVTVRGHVQIEYAGEEPHTVPAGTVLEGRSDEGE